MWIGFIAASNWSLEVCLCGVIGSMAETFGSFVEPMTFQYSSNKYYDNSLSLFLLQLGNKQKTQDCHTSHRQQHVCFALHGCDVYARDWLGDLFAILCLWRFVSFLSSHKDMSTLLLIPYIPDRRQTFPLH